MPKFDTYPAGTPSWVDLSSSDPAAAKGFYTELLGWTVDELGPEAGGYAMFQKGGLNVAGVGPIMGEGQPSAWMTYVTTDDADASVAAAKAAGATVLVEPMDVLDVGRMAVFADPAGGVIAVWQPKAHHGAQLANEPGTLCWNELQTRDEDAAKAFYAAVFGWGAETSDMGDMRYTEWKRGDDSVGGMLPMPAEVPAQVPPYWLAYFAVDDADATVEAAGKLGGATVVPATDIPPGRFAVLSDPSGATFAVIKTATA
jgi:uncharacterized protein